MSLPHLACCDVLETLFVATACSFWFFSSKVANLLFCAACTDDAVIQVPLDGVVTQYSTRSHVRVRWVYFFRGCQWAASLKDDSKLVKSKLRESKLGSCRPCHPLLARLPVPQGLSLHCVGSSGDHYWSSHWFSNKQHYLSGSSIFYASEWHLPHVPYLSDSVPIAGMHVARD